MLMSFPELVAKFDLKIDGVLHLGAHLAEEAPLYDAAGVGRVWWVEANPAVLPKIEQALAGFADQKLIQGLVYAESGTVLQFNVTNYDGMSSSILEFGTHPEFSPDTVFVDRIPLATITVDDIVEENGVVANFLNMDLQGAELTALMGATGFLEQVDYVLTEVNKAEVYVGCARVEMLDLYLDAFDRVETCWVGDQGWGDALYVRRSR